MTIDTQTLFRQKQVQFGAGSSPARFTTDFLTAVKRAQADFATRASITSTGISNVETDIDLDEKYESYFTACVDFHLLMLGHNPGFDINVAAAARQDGIKDAQMRAFQDNTSLVTKLDLDS